VDFENFSVEELLDLLETSQVIEKDAYGVKVAILPDGEFIKILRRKKFWKGNEAAKVKKFCANAKELEKRAVQTLVPLRILKIAEQHKAAVIYEPLDGTPLRKALMDMAERKIAKTLFGLAVFIHSLHQQGIYFRSLHADNILLTDTNEFGLIDILDMEFSRKPLSISMRARNFRHLFRLNNLAKWHSSIVECYLEVAEFSEWKKKWLRRQLQQYLSVS